MNELNKKENHIVIDAGNTSVKIALVSEGQIINVQRFSKEEILRNPVEIVDLLPLKGIISSVLNKVDTDLLSSLFKNTILFTSGLKLPIALKYETPETLGKDRIANAVASYSRSKSNAVSIDVGTCVKFDFVSAEGNYQGGSISPGIHLRYKSLNDYTANLPLLSITEKTPLIGKNTNESISSGVINGIEAEINQLIDRYNQEFNDLTFFMTGGDAKHFDFHAKSNIFAIENLTLEGLYQIYLLNER